VLLFAYLGLSGRQRNVQRTAAGKDGYSTPRNVISR